MGFARRAISGLLPLLVPAACAAAAPAPASQPAARIVYPWIPDQRDGTYKNPVICADYSDPDVIRDGDDYWMTASSFTWTPGLPILHSRDLVNWTIINHAINNLPDPRGVFDTFRPGEGVWAPAIRKHAGRFYIFFPMPDEGIYVTTAADPRGKWSKPALLLEGKGLIDPCPLWDDDGHAYLVHAYAKSRAGIKDVLRVRPMSPDATKILGEGKVVYTDPEHQRTLEGPKFHKFNGVYYISAPAGGVGTGWQLILRSKSVYGPYEPKVVLEQGPTSPINGPHQGALVDTSDRKEWWFVHFQDAGVYGRITHLQPVRWQNGWPLMGEDRDGNGVGEPVLQHAKPAVAGDVKVETPQTSDEFDGDALGLQWQWQANYRDDWASLTDRRGWLRLRAASAEADLGKLPNALCQKFPAREFSVETRVQLDASSPNVQAGLIVTGQKHAAIVVQQIGSQPHARVIVNNEVKDDVPVDRDTVDLRVDVVDGGVCRFSYASGDGHFRQLGPPFQAVEGKWVGAKVGVFCRALDAAATAGHADFDDFRFATPAKD